MLVARKSSGSRSAGRDTQVPRSVDNVLIDAMLAPLFLRTTLSSSEVSILPSIVVHLLTKLLAWPRSFTCLQQFSYPEHRTSLP